MAALYRARFIDRLDSAESARRASLEVLKARRGRKESDSPFYWAGFVASGDWR
jgi:CHAT domain-containing protein